MCSFSQAPEPKGPSVVSSNPPHSLAEPSTISKHGSGYFVLQCPRWFSSGPGPLPVLGREAFRESEESERCFPQGYCPANHPTVAFLKPPSRTQVGTLRTPCSHLNCHLKQLNLKIQFLGGRSCLSSARQPREAGGHRARCQTRSTSLAAESAMRRGCTIGSGPDTANPRYSGL